MAFFTDSPEYSATLLPREIVGKLVGDGSPAPEITPVILRILDPSKPTLSSPATDLPWDHLLVSEVSSSSNYDRLIELVRSDVRVPDRVACMAGSGSGFHGFKGRAWAALPGNIHLAVHLAPGRPVDRYQVSFTALAAVSVVDALSTVPGLHASPRIKWVNDILLSDAKVGGVLAYTQSQGERVGSAVLGIGVNVNTAPEIEPTPFVPRTSSVLREMASSPRATLLGSVFQELLHALSRNYDLLLQEGFEPLLARYRDVAMVQGEEVLICAETSDRVLTVLAEGRVKGIGNNLELLLDGHPEPVTGGRLAMRPDTAYTTQLEDGVRRSGDPGDEETQGLS